MHMMWNKQLLGVMRGTGKKNGPPKRAVVILINNR